MGQIGEEAKRTNIFKADGTLKNGM